MSLADLVAESIAGWDDALEVALFGTPDPDEIAATIEALCAEHLAPVADGLYYRPGVGVVAGLLLADGRSVAVKVHRWRTDVARLTGMQAVQRHVHERDLPAPLPLLAPTALGSGIATAEEWRPGERVDGHSDDVRAALAGGLHPVVRAASDLVGKVDVRPPAILRPAGAPLWFEPHSVRFDFAATAAGAEWIDAAAEDARAVLSSVADLPDVIGHFDWRVENVGFTGGTLSAIYDWDSLALAPEAVLVGSTAAQFCTDWAVEGDQVPTIEEMTAFVADYEGVRGEAFSARERAVLDAGNLALIAYGARCQHSDLTFHPELGGSGSSHWLRLLRDRLGRGAPAF